MRTTHHDAALRHVIYVSSAAAGGPAGCFASMCSHARDNNIARGIGGVLLYDGQRFAQWLCGPDEPVRALMARIAEDPRHEAVRVLLDGPLPDAPATRVWRSGYTAPDVIPTYAVRASAPGADALAELVLLLPQADLWPPADSSVTRPAR